MRIPVSTLAGFLDLPEGTTPERLAEAFIRIGLEVEEIHRPETVTGPLVVGRVVDIEELTGFKKPIRYCQVDVGETDEQGAPATSGIICGARNFAVDDLVVVARPGAVLPGGFEITARRTYDRMSNGMICSVKELGIGDDHDGILVLPPNQAQPGADAAALLGLGDAVLELAPTPDRGYCLSVRGLAREIACAFDLSYADPALAEIPPADGEAWPVRVEDPLGCPRFTARLVTGLDVSAPTPLWMRLRLMACGMRPISLPVDVTNYVMLLLGQPLHAFDAGRLTGDIVVRRAVAGEKLTTLDDIGRELDPEDLLVCDQTGPLGIAGVMGGAATEVGPDTTDVLLEAATWHPGSVSRSARRHKLPSEAAKRFERGVDPALPAVAAELAADLLVRYGGAVLAPGRTDIGGVPERASISMPVDLPDQVAGTRYPAGVTARRLRQVGCAVEEAGTGLLRVLPPSWRPDLVHQADLVEEVLRLEGYDSIPSTLPTAPAGRGLSEGQRRRRAVTRAMAHAGYVEVLPFPFTGPALWDELGLAADDIRRRTHRVTNPLEADKPELTSTLLTGLLEVLRRNVSRGARDAALFTVAQVTLPRTDQAPVPDIAVTTRPSAEDFARLEAALPNQPTHVGAVLCGAWEAPGWWGPGRPVEWGDAVRAAHIVAEASGVELRVVPADLAPWHPGRCAELRVGDWPVGHAGELHPKVVEALGLPKRACAMEIDLDALPISERRPAPVVSPYPAVLLDLAFVVEQSVPVAELLEEIRRAGGLLLEDARLFDVYVGDQIEAGRRSVAFTLRFRSPDRTLTSDEVAVRRHGIVTALAERFGAELRG